jgi:hypothetical protein
VRETNRYANSVDETGTKRGGARWKELTTSGLKAFLAVILIMGMKRQPNIRTYWYREPSIFHCPTISRAFSRSRFQALTNCLHVTNWETYGIERGMPGYDKLHQVRWLVDELRRLFRREWELGEFLTVDEMMIGYKGTYCPMRQYLPNKPCKCGIKVWCLTNSSSKYVYDFDVYCGHDHNLAVDAEPMQPVMRGEPRLAHNVVLKLVRDLEGKGHVIVMDNYFSSIGLFEELRGMEIYATRTVRTNRVGLPSELKNTAAFRRASQGELEWRMHEDPGISTVMWKGKRPVLLISSHAMPIGYPCVPVITVPRRDGAERNNIITSPVHHEYTTHILGVDVADQLRASYSCQTQSHKWWHWIFFFLLDTTVVNMCLLYLGHVRHSRHRRSFLTHLEFRTKFVEGLLRNWGGE